MAQEPASPPRRGGDKLGVLDRSLVIDSGDGGRLLGGLLNRRAGQAEGYADRNRVLRFQTEFRLVLAICQTGFVDSCECEEWTARAGQQMTSQQE